MYNFAVMKKLLTLFFASSLLSVSAQLQPVLKNKRGINILPQKGDYCIGFSANPFLTYFGNMFNNSTSNNSPAATFAAPGQMLFGKYMKDEQLAYRASFRFGINNNTLSYNVVDISPGAAVNAQVTDLQKMRNTILGIALGFERRKGNTRLQGFYGAEFFMNYNSGTNTKYEYGNKIEYFDTGVMRTTKIRSSSVFSLGIRGFAGIEYFIAPRISFGAELGYGPSFFFRSASESTYEQYDFNKSEIIEEKTALSPKNKGFTLDTDNYNGILKLLFYF
jgi:hypothetical protein